MYIIGIGRYCGIHTRTKHMLTWCQPLVLLPPHVILNAAFQCHPPVMISASLPLCLALPPTLSLCLPPLPSPYPPPLCPPPSSYMTCVRSPSPSSYMDRLFLSPRGASVYLPTCVSTQVQPGQKSCLPPALKSAAPTRLGSQVSPSI